MLKSAWPAIKQVLLKTYITCVCNYYVTCLQLMITFTRIEMWKLLLITFGYRL